MMSRRFAVVPASPAGRSVGRRFRPLCDAVESRLLLSTFTVTNTGDSGPGSLRRAIIDSNASPGANTISFAIPGAGVQVIRPLTSLPAVTNPVVIEGDSQPGSVPSTATQGDNAAPAIVIDGASLTDPAHCLGLQIKADNSTVRGLAIDDFSGVGVLFEGANDHLEGCFVGVDATGKVAQPNGLGVAVFGGGAVIGGPTAAARNVISGNTAGLGIASLGIGGASLLTATAGSVVENNLIGTDATGVAALGNRVVGVALIGSGNVVGGTGAGQANTIAFNGQTGAGVVVAALHQTADSPFGVASAGDLISGNAIYGNHALGIGLLDVPMSTVLPLLETSSADIPSVISSLVANLDLSVAPNVHLRPASGPNNGQNFPVLSSAVTADGATTVRGTLDATPNTAYRVQFFSSPAADASGYGEGQLFLGEATVSTDARGLAPIVFTPATAVPIGQVIAATAIDPGNDTSEFSNAAEVTPPGVAPAPVTPVPVAHALSPALPVPSPAPAVALGTAHRTHRHAIALIGMTTNLVTTDHASIAHITGHGHLAKLGSVTITSVIDSKGERPLLSTPWLLHADLVIASPKGQVNVRISPGTIGLNPFAQPVHLQYAIQGGTGAFRNAAGKGLVDLRLFQAIPTSASGLKALGNQLKTSGIRFTLTFHPGHLNKFGDFSSTWYKIIQTAAKSRGHGHKHAPKR